MDRGDGGWHALDPQDHAARRGHRHLRQL